MRTKFERVPSEPLPSAISLDLAKFLDPSNFWENQPIHLNGDERRRNDHPPRQPARPQITLSDRKTKRNGS